MKKTLSLNRRYVGVLFVLFLTALLSEGCGKPKGSVSGQVTYNGKPLKTGFVTFVPEKGPAVDSPIDGEGNYHVKNVPVGTAKIGVRSEAAANSEAMGQVKNPKVRSRTTKPHPTTTSSSPVSTKLRSRLLRYLRFAAGHRPPAPTATLRAPPPPPLKS
jgi:hypothetical protein